MYTTAYEPGLKFTSPEGYELMASPEMIAVLHNWQFGLSRDHFKDPDKNVIVLSTSGWVRIRKVEETLAAAMETWERHTEEQLALQEADQS